MGAGGKLTNLRPKNLNIGPKPKKRQYRADNQMHKNKAY
jgi:hypothetical protein